MARNDYDVIDLISSDDDGNEDNGPSSIDEGEKKSSATTSARDESKKITSNTEKANKLIPSNPYSGKRKQKDDEERPEPTSADNQVIKSQKVFPQCQKLKKPKTRHESKQTRKLQTGLVIDQDTDEMNIEDENVKSYLEEQQKRHQTGALIALYLDKEFLTNSYSIDGMHSASKKIKCRCSPPSIAKLRFKTKDNVCRAFYSCINNKCDFYRAACRANFMHWYRFGSHVNHSILQKNYSANDLVQGRVGNCWFLSALAVIAARPDLIKQILPNSDVQNELLDTYGICQVQLFMDGYWRQITLDNFLPCLIEDVSMDPTKMAFDNDIRLAIQESLGNIVESSYQDNNQSKLPRESDSFALSEENQKEIINSKEYLYSMACKECPEISSQMSLTPKKLNKRITSEDLAYSKAKQNQLWVPFIEKAYAKIHGSYQAISGGQIAEAFLDLTGAPTLEYYFDKPTFNAKSFWKSLLHYRQQRLPLGCGTGGQRFGQLSEVGLVSGHAYSILDVVEIRNVGFEFFQGDQSSMGNVSGFTSNDGIVRLLRIRNPHGKGEWKGAFSDQSDLWEKLVLYQSVNFEEKSSKNLERTHKNDGTFWIDYDHFLMSFTNVDVVLAFEGNHGKSYSSNFPAKTSNHRCSRAFEVTMLDEHSCPHDEVEVYVLGIQKTRRGATRGRSDRKKSYKHCDLGFLVGTLKEKRGENSASHLFEKIEGKMLGFTRVGHHHIKLQRGFNKSVIVMPVSFGHPAATDKNLSFVVRFVSNAPIMVKELAEVPRLDFVFHQFCLQENTLLNLPGQAKRQLLYKDESFKVFKVDCTGCWRNDYMESCGGIIFIYLHVNEELLQNNDKAGHSFKVYIECRGMSVRTEDGILQHEKMKPEKPRKNFTAAWRKHTISFENEKKSRLLLSLFKSGYDTELGCIKFIPSSNGSGLFGNIKKKITDHLKVSKTNGLDYETRGIFASVDNMINFQSFTDFNAASILKPNMKNDMEDDLELQMAIALSKEESDLHQAIERSKVDSNNEQMLGETMDKWTNSYEGKIILEPQMCDADQYPSAETQVSTVEKVTKDENKKLQDTPATLVDLCLDTDDSNMSVFDEKVSHGRSRTIYKPSCLEMIESMKCPNGTQDSFLTNKNQMNSGSNDFSSTILKNNDTKDSLTKAAALVDLSKEQDDSNFSGSQQLDNKAEDKNERKSNSFTYNEESIDTKSEKETDSKSNGKIFPSQIRGETLCKENGQTRKDTTQCNKMVSRETEALCDKSPHNDKKSFIIKKHNQNISIRNLELLDSSQSEYDDEGSSMGLQTQENLEQLSDSTRTNSSTDNNSTENVENVIEIDDAVLEKRVIEEEAIISTQINLNNLKQTDLGKTLSNNTASKSIKPDVCETKSVEDGNTENLIEIDDTISDKRNADDGEAPILTQTSKKRLEQTDLDNNLSNRFKSNPRKQDDCETEFSEDGNGEDIIEIDDNVSEMGSIEEEEGPMSTQTIKKRLEQTDLDNNISNDTSSTSRKPDDSELQPGNGRNVENTIENGYTASEMKGIEEEVQNSSNNLEQYDLDKTISNDTASKSPKPDSSKIELSDDRNVENIIEIDDTVSEMRGMEGEEAQILTHNSAKRLKQSDLDKTLSNSTASKFPKPDDSEIELSEDESTDLEDEAEYVRKLKEILIKKRKEIEEETER